jgi:hypothetical protein
MPGGFHGNGNVKLKRFVIRNGNGNKAVLFGNNVAPELLLQSVYVINPSAYFGELHIVTGPPPLANPYPARKDSRSAAIATGAGEGWRCHELADFSL